MAKVPPFRGDQPQILSAAFPFYTPQGGVAYYQPQFFAIPADVNIDYDSAVPSIYEITGVGWQLAYLIGLWNYICAPTGSKTALPGQVVRGAAVTLGIAP